ncbi:hypothetical protein [Roseomonas chloroacetimidivorans]|uniref:hypothetical protein n=1 Tax=Roseomonas chloroacetimidivorans TaxID=1766656 RepID=UPI003C785DDC
MTIEALTLDQIQADPQVVIQAALDADPLLWWGGIFDWAFERRRGDLHGQSPEERYAVRREGTLIESGVGQVLRAAEFIEWAPRIKSVNRARGTYGWKHVAERFHKARDPEANYYVGEGAFIIAARAMGLTVAPDSIWHFRVNLSEKAATEARRLDDERFRRRWGRVPERIGA